MAYRTLGDAIEILYVWTKENGDKFNLRPIGSKMTYVLENVNMPGDTCFLRLNHGDITGNGSLFSLEKIYKG